MDSCKGREKDPAYHLNGAGAKEAAEEDGMSRVAAAPSSLNDPTSQHAGKSTELTKYTKKMQSSVPFNQHII